MRPTHSGRIPHGSRIAYNFPSASITRLYAPRSDGSISIIRSRKLGPSACNNNQAIASLSVVEFNKSCGSCSRKAGPLIRLPLCATAIAVETCPCSGLHSPHNLSLSSSSGHDQCHTSLQVDPSLCQRRPHVPYPLPRDAQFSPRHRTPPFPHFPAHGAAKPSVPVSNNDAPQC